MSLMLDFYGLREHPFGVSPNPRFLYSSTQHCEALEQLVMGIEDYEGLQALIGEAGSGKTTVLLDLVQRYREQADVAFVFNTQCNGEALLRLIAINLHIEGVATERDPLRLNQLLAGFVSNSGRTKPVIIIIDEAQNLDGSALETVRLLSNLESVDHKFLHIILAGQPALEANLRSADHAQLLQRITTITRVEALLATQVKEYVDHRLRVAGYSGAPLFTEEALNRIIKASRGIPREVNRLCANALKLGFALKQRELAGGIVEAVLAELDPEAKAQEHKPEPITAVETPEAEAKADAPGPERGVSAEAMTGHVEEAGPVRGSLGEKVFETLLPELGSIETSKAVQESNERAEAQSWTLDPKIDLSLADQMIDSVLSGVDVPAQSARVETKEKAKPENPKLEPVAENVPTEAQKTSGGYGFEDASLAAFLSKLDSDPELSGELSPKVKEQQRAKDKEKTSGYRPTPKAKPQAAAAGEGPKLVPQPPAVSTPQTPPTPEPIPMDPRVSKIFPPRTQRVVIRTQGAAAEALQPEVHPDPRVSQIFAPRIVSQETPTEGIDDDLRDSFRPVAVPAPEPKSAPRMALEKVVRLKDATKAEGERRVRHLHAGIVIPVAATVLALLLLLALNGALHIPFPWAKRPVPRPMPVLPKPVVDDSETQSASNAQETTSAKDSSRAVLVKMVRPVYPASATRSHVNGNVTLKVSIGADGLVHHTKVLNGNPMLARAAVNAVQKWRYTPARQNGVPVAGEETVVVSFDERK